MNVTWFAFCVLLSVAIDTAWVALFRARPVGQFKVDRQTDGEIRFTSTTGRFVINRASRTLSYTSGKQRGLLSFEEIKGLEYRVNERYALLTELFFGFDGTDLLPQYQDAVAWFSIAALTADGRRIPLFLSGQYQPREFMLSWYIDLQAQLLDRLGLQTDVEEQSRGALNAIQARVPGTRLV